MEYNLFYICKNDYFNRVKPLGHVEMIYRKTQIGGWLIVFFTIPILWLVFAYFQHWGSRPLTELSLAFAIILLTLIVLLFYRLTVEVKNNRIRLTYGIGLIKITLKIDELISTRVLKTPWYYGLGIRITPKGMLYNIQGSRAVLVEYMHKGELKTVMVGSAEPEKLKEILDSRIPHED